MTGQEWEGVVAFLNASWPQTQLSDATVEAWYVAVQDLDQQDALTAVEALLREGREFPPNGGQIRQKTIELAAPPADWSRGYTLAMNNPVSYLHDGAEALDWLHARDPVAAETVRRFGVASWGMGSDMPEATRAQFRQIYELAAAAVRDGLTYAGLPEVTGPRRLGEAVRQVMPPRKELSE